MPTGDPYCPIHGFTPCGCREFLLPQVPIPPRKPVDSPIKIIAGNPELERLCRELVKIANSDYGFADETKEQALLEKIREIERLLP